ncbi:LytR C-terminal domain-containing protein [Corynebacterium bovis]|uniref:LytR C-terminal domain-containing protein n=1 Tax=Corynebacterium bovis TaxID=36808 RepID=UPI002446C9D1|nr:LytR C-terminal domain-containing protein [Corynebacterium bovis]MDH2456475.1 LytR C-terminal domain-containing protein [Corynebacterium bovis]
MTSSHRPRHSLDDDDDFLLGDDPAAVPAGPAASPDPDAPEAERSGPPLRGLAMILTAVAVLLIAWGAYSFFSGRGDDGSDGPSAAGAGGAAASTAQQPGRGAAGASAPAAAPTEGGAPASPAAPAGEAQRSDQAGGAQQSGQAQQSQQSGQAAQSGGDVEVDRGRTVVTVLNNSPVQGLASDTAAKLKQDRWTRTGYGNLPDEAGAFPESVVLYPGGNAEAKAAAEAIAADLHITARQRDAGIDRQLAGAAMLDGPGPSNVVVVTTRDLR